MNNSLILTPENDPFFYQTLYQNPLIANRNSQFFVVNPDTLLLENIGEHELVDYVGSGELEYVENYWDNVNDYYNPLEN